MFEVFALFVMCLAALAKLAIVAVSVVGASVLACGALRAVRFIWSASNVKESDNG